MTRARATTPRLLVLDLDGTTLRRDRTVAPEDQRAVRALHAAGVRVSIATGRLWSGTAPIARMLGLDGPSACMNGSEVRCSRSGALHVQHALDVAVREHTRRVLRTHGLAAFVFRDEHILHDRSGAAYLPAVRMWGTATREHDDVWQSPVWRDAEGVLAACGFGTETAVRAAARALRGMVEPTVEVAAFPSGSLAGWWYLVVRDGRTDKGTSLAALAEAAGCDVGGVVAVGDYYNDLPMLVTAGRSFAMGQAPDDVKSAATDVLEATHTTGGAVAEVARRVWGVEVAPD